MIAKFACALLLLAAFSKAENAETLDLNADKEAAKTKLTQMAARTTQIMQSAKQLLEENKIYFKDSVPAYITDINEIYASADNELKIITNVFFGDAIDKGKPVSTFKCLAKAMDETKKLLSDSKSTSTNCVNEVFNRQTGEINGLILQLDLINEATTGMYDSIHTNIDKCQNSNEVTQLMHRAELREATLKKLVTKYAERGSELRIDFNDSSMNCVNGSRAFVANAFRICQNKMKAC